MANDRFALEGIEGKTLGLGALWTFAILWLVFAEARNHEKQAESTQKHSQPFSLSLTHFSLSLEVLRHF